MFIGLGGQDRMQQQHLAEYRLQPILEVRPNRLPKSDGNPWCCSKARNKIKIKLTCYNMLKLQLCIWLWGSCGLLLFSIVFVKFVSTSYMFACILVACCFLMFFVFVCVCMCLCLFRFVGWLFFLRLLVCLFGSVWLLVWFRLFIGLVWFVYLFGLLVGCLVLLLFLLFALLLVVSFFPLSHEWDIWRHLNHGPGSSGYLQFHVESEEFNFSMSPGWSVGLQFFASKITDTMNVLARVVGEKFKKQWNIISTHAIVSFGFWNYFPLNQLPFVTYLDIYGREMLCDYFSIN